MNGFIVLAVIALANAAASAAVGKEDLVVTPCSEQDQECVKKNIQQFLTTAADGFSKYDIKAYDPLNIDELNVEWNGQALAFKNIKIHGFKNQAVTFAEVAKETGSFKSTTDVSVEADLFVKGDKEYTDKYTIKATVEGGVTFPREVKNKDGKDHIVLGDATITCDVKNAPEVTYGPKLVEAFTKDANLAAQVKVAKEDLVEIRKKIVCEFAHKVYEAIIANLRKYLATVPRENIYKQ